VIRAPDFWQQPAGLRAKLLSPLSALWTYAGRSRIKRPGAKVSVPVICVGNLSMGGTGKTPTVISIVAELAKQDISTHIVSRGYGGTISGPTLVTDHHTAQDVGDEPLLLSAFAPIWVAKDRSAAANAAVEAGAQVIVMDDGFQNPALAKDLSVVVVDAARGFGNGRVFPAGPLREPVQDGLRRAQAVLVIGNPIAQDKFAKDFENRFAGTVIRGHLKPLETGMDWSGLRCMAFAGIGYPEKFFETLAELGADVVKKVPLGDHAPLSETLLRRLVAEAQQLNAQLVTTEKDAVRLPADYRSEVLTLPVRLEYADPSALDDLLKPIVSRVIQN
jgi:tetraacyldisaccharide 4'-kinase